MPLYDFLFLFYICIMNRKQFTNTIASFAFILVFFLPDSSFSQQIKKSESEKPSFKERLFIGGALGFSLGSYSSLIDVSPIIGYAVSSDLIVGVGLTYKYYQYKDYYRGLDSVGSPTNDWYDFKTNMYGGSFWVRYFLSKTEIPVIENIFLHGEVEPLVFINNYSYNPQGDYIDVYGNRYINEDERISLTGVFLGGGLRQMIGGRSYMYLELLWNFNEEIYSPYSNPRIRIGVAVGF